MTTTTAIPYGSEFTSHGTRRKRPYSKRTSKSESIKVVQCKYCYIEVLAVRDSKRTRCEDCLRIYSYAMRHNVEPIYQIRGVKPIN